MTTYHFLTLWLATAYWSAYLRGDKQPRATARNRPETGMTMMNSGSNRLLDELAKLMTDAAGAAQGVRREMETAMRSQLERLLNSMDLVKREEFEAVRDMAIKAREENDALAARLDALEKKQSGMPTNDGAEAGKPSAAKKAPSKKS